MAEENNQKNMNIVNDSDAEVSSDFAPDESSATPKNVSTVESRPLGIKQNLIPKNVSRPTWLRRSLIVSLVLGLMAGFVGGLFGSGFTENNTVGTSNLAEQKKIVSSESQLISSIAKTVGPSVVSVNVTTLEAGQTTMFGFAQPQQLSSAGTGIIISSSGIVMTNRHVVPAGTQSVSVTLSDGTELTDVEVLGRTSENDSLDVAFLKIKNTKGKKLTVAKIGNSSKVEVGDTVVAIGNALGQFQNTVTSGIISGYGRSVQASDSTGQAAENLDDLFQTDAAINEGNSGGPLVDMNGQIIGLNTAIAGNAQNIGFAIPISNITGLIKQVIQTGKLARPYIGVRFVSLTDDYAYQLNLNTKRGAYIAPTVNGAAPAIVAGSPAEKAGLKEKDIITKIDGVNIDETHSLVSLLGQHMPGDNVVLTVVRGDKTITIKVTLGTAATN